MTKKELLDYIGNKAEGLSESELGELASYADFLEWRREMDDLREQYEESMKDIERGDVYTLEEIG